MNHRSGPPIDSDPNLAAITAELVTERVPNPPRGYAVVENITIDGCTIHGSSQYGFADVVARWLFKHGYRAGQGAVAAYEAAERYLADECGLSPEFVRCNRRRSIAQGLRSLQVGQLASAMWVAGFPGEREETSWAAVASGSTEVDSIARAVDRLVRNGYRVGMSRAMTVKLLEADGGPDWGYQPGPLDSPWIADLEARGRRGAILGNPVPRRQHTAADIVDLVRESLEG